MKPRDARRCSLFKPYVWGQQHIANLGRKHNLEYRKWLPTSLPVQICYQHFGAFNTRARCSMLLSFPPGSWLHVVLCAFVSATLIVISDGDALGSASWATVGSLALLMSKGGLCPSSVHLVPFGSSLYALGGESLQANVFRSRDSGVSWDKIASNAYSPARDCFATAVTRSRIHVLGGFSCYSSDYHPGHWYSAGCRTDTHVSTTDGINFDSETAFPDVSVAVLFTAVGVTINNTDYVYTSASGSSDTGPYTNILRRYNTASKSWQTLVAITTDSSGHSYGVRAFTQIKATSDGTLFLAGGDGNPTFTVQHRDLWASRDEGFTWNKCSLSVSQGNGPAIVGYGDTLYIFSQNQMWSTRDRGITFTTWSQTLDGDPLSSTFDIGAVNYYSAHNGFLFLVKGGRNDTNVMRSSQIKLSNDQITFASFTIAPSDRFAGKSPVPVTLAFIPATPIPVGGSITLNYPSGFFGASFSNDNCFSASSLFGLVAKCSSTTSSSIVMYPTFQSSIPAVLLNLTISGLTLGNETSGGYVSLETSVDLTASSGIESGSIFAYTRVTVASFTIAPSDRFAGKSPVPVTLAFIPATPIPVGGSITLNYPPGFFASSVTPTVKSGASSVAGLTATCGATTAAFVVISSMGVAIGASVLFTVTISGFKMGAVTFGAVSVSVATSSETAASAAVASGAIASQAHKTTFAALSRPRSWLAAVTAASLPEQNLVFFAGGSLPSNIVDIFNGSEWATASILETHDRFVAATSLPVQGLALFASADYVSTSVSIYNANSRTWGRGNVSLSCPSVAAASLPGQGLAIFAGCRTVQIYNGSTGNWKTEKLTCFRNRLAAASLPAQGLALFAGGEAQNGVLLRGCVVGICDLMCDGCIVSR
jgi:hypothetical protein